MLVNEYYIARHSSYILYSFEFIANVFVFFIVIYLYKTRKDRKSIWVFLLTGLAHSTLELIAQGLGIRVIEGAYLFNISIGYPYICFIMGFFEGGIVCLAGYHFVKYITDKNRFSFKFFLSLSIILFILIFVGGILARLQIGFDNTERSITRRIIFNPLNILFEVLFYVIPILYFLFYPKVKKEDRITLFYFYLGIILFTMFFVIPNHILGIRFIEIKKDDYYETASLIEQIVVMYGYNIPFESAGFLIQYYILIYHFNLIQFSRNND